MANCPATKRKPSLRVQRKEKSRSVQWWTQVTVSPWKAAGIFGEAAGKGRSWRPLHAAARQRMQPPDARGWLAPAPGRGRMRRRPRTEEPAMPDASTRRRRRSAPRWTRRPGRCPRACRTAAGRWTWSRCTSATRRSSGRRRGAAARRGPRPPGPISATAPSPPKRRCGASSAASRPPTTRWPGRCGRTAAAPPMAG